MNAAAAVSVPTLTVSRAQSPLNRPVPPTAPSAALRAVAALAGREPAA